MIAVNLEKWNGSFQIVSDHVWWQITDSPLHSHLMACNCVWRLYGPKQTHNWSTSLKFYSDSTLLILWLPPLGTKQSGCIFILVCNTSSLNLIYAICIKVIKGLNSTWVNLIMSCFSLSRPSLHLWKAVRTLIKTKFSTKYLWVT